MTAIRYLSLFTHTGSREQRPAAVLAAAIIRG